jgi:exonuclease III
MLDDYLRQQDIDVVLLQEVTHTKITSLRRYQTYVNVGTENRGTAILAKEGLSLTDIIRFPSGRRIAVCYEGIGIINI